MTKTLIQSARVATFERHHFIMKGHVTWKYVLQFLKVFGFCITIKHCLPRTKREICFNGLYFGWVLLSLYIVSTYIFDVFLRKSVSDISLIMVHNVDLLCVIAMSYVLRSILGRLFDAIEKMNQLRKTIDFNNLPIKTRFCYFLFLAVSVQFCVNIYRTVNPRNPGDYVVMSTFGLLSSSTTHRVAAITIAMKSLTSLSYAFFNFIPTLCAVVIYLTQVDNFLLIHAYTTSLKSMLVKSDMTFKRLMKVMDEYSELTCLVKRVNDSISCLAFILFGFLLISLCYSLSVMMQLKREDAFRISAYALSVGIFAFEFIFMVNAAVRVAQELEEAQNQLTLRTELDSAQRVDATGAANLLFIHSAFKRFRQDVSVVPLGMFQLEKKLFLSVFGLIITYEIIILQFSCSNL